MINNRDKKIITEEKVEEVEINDEKKRKLITEYIKSCKEKGTYCQMDKLLESYLPKELLYEENEKGIH